MEKPTASASGAKSALAAPVMEKHRHEHREHAEHREEARHSGLHRAVERGACGRYAAGEMRGMFSMATVASSTRMPTASARPPSVMR